MQRTTKALGGTIRPPGTASLRLEFSDLAACLPDATRIDWRLLRQTVYVLVGVGAIGRPLAEALAYLGMRRCILVDPKDYKSQSRVSQCNPDEVGRPKALVVARMLRRLGVDTLYLIDDIEYLQPGYICPGTILLTSADNRRADVHAGRLAAQMRERLLKVNVAPEYLMASIRTYDFRQGPPEVCLECQMTDAQYDDQQHPLSCDAGPEQPTGSPRALCQFAANAAAMVAAQIAGSPDRWARRWHARQWQQMMLGGAGSMLELSPKKDCRWEHACHWENLVRLSSGPRHTRLRDLASMAAISQDASLRLRFSSRVTTQANCTRCGRQQELLRWVARLDQPLGRCACGGQLKAEPFFACYDLASEAFRTVWNQPLDQWGVPERSIIALETNGRQWSYVLASDAGSEPRRR